MEPVGFAGVKPLLKSPEERADMCEGAYLEATVDGICTPVYFGSDVTLASRQNVIDVLWRSLESGLLVCTDWMPVYDINGVERPLTLQDLYDPGEEDPVEGAKDCTARWRDVDYQLTPEGEALIKGTHIEGQRELSPLFFQRLSEIFTAHGVGWDVPCPYRVVPWLKPWWIHERPPEVG